jgi:TRAP-type C4-dicarboxylate transport system permease small subunit
MATEPTPSPGRRNPRTRVPLKIEEALAAAGMALLALITFANVVFRYATDVSFAFTEEYSIALMVIVTLLGASVAVAGDRHIRIGFFVDRLPPRRRRLFQLLSVAVAVAIFGILVALGGRLAYDEWRFEDTSPGLGVPQWIYTVWLPVLSAVIVLRAVGRGMRVWRGEDR